MMQQQSRERRKEEEEEEEEEAPPKQVAVAMERLSEAGRVIGDIRIGADRLLEALFAAAAASQSQSQPNSKTKPIHFILKEEASMRHHLQLLQSIGRKLEDSGVLNGSLRSRSNSWGLHMPLVCPDGAVVAYAWKRQLAGQAGASAVDRTRLALKAFTDQKRRFFPHLEDEPSGQISGEDSGMSKRHCGAQASISGNKEAQKEDRTLSGVLTHLEKEAHGIRICTYQRLDWLRRASSMSASSNENSSQSSKEDNLHSLSRLRTNSVGVVPWDQVAVIELVVPSVFRAVVSLHPAGSVDPDAVAFFSPDEGGSYIHARGFSIYHLYRHITEHAVKALQYFLSTKTDMALYYLLHWVSSYHTLFTKVCSKCGRLLTMDRQSALLLPPVRRPYRHSSTTNPLSTQSTVFTANQSQDLSKAYHVGCFIDEA